jgi:HD-GYP domain-containing protein (c-di-GMP phosphodiesterase class II)
MLGEITKNKAVDSGALVDVSDELSNRLKSANASTIVSLINALAPVDEYVQRHCVNTGLLNGLIGRWLGLDAEAVDRLVLIGLLHDCGKALMPPSVLNAPRKLSGVEYQVIKNHPIRSYELLADFPDIVRQSARSHHENVDGTGYPDRLMGNDILLEARITAISDIYDAMVSKRAYKTPRSPFSVMAYLLGLAGSVLDAGLVDIFISHMPHELIGKQVMLSDETIGIVRSIDAGEIEYPTVEIEGRRVKTSPDLFCTSMY